MTNEPHSIAQWESYLQWIFSICWALLVTSISCLEYYRYYDVFPPSRSWPILLSPGVAMVVASHTFIRYICKSNEYENAKKVMYLNIAGIVFISIWCAIVIFFIPKLWHFQWLGALYLFFIIWDNLMLLFLDSPKKNNLDILHIRTTNRLINWPTITALILAWAFVHFLDPWSAHYYSAFPIRDASLLSEKVKEVFLSGVVSFHVVFGAVSYLLESTDTSIPIYKLFTKN